MQLLGAHALDLGFYPSSLAKQAELFPDHRECAQQSGVAQAIPRHSPRVHSPHPTTHITVTPQGHSAIASGKKAVGSGSKTSSVPMPSCGSFPAMADTEDLGRSRKTLLLCPVPAHSRESQNQVVKTQPQGGRL